MFNMLYTMKLNVNLGELYVLHLISCNAALSNRELYRMIKAKDTWTIRRYLSKLRALGLIVQRRSSYHRVTNYITSEGLRIISKIYDEFNDSSVIVSHFIKNAGEA